MQLWLRLCLRLWAIAMGVFLLSGPRVYAVNLIVNGDFEAGNTGFTTDYTHDSTPPMSGLGYYAIGTNPKTWNNLWASYGDHTSGSGKMFIADGYTVGDKTVWQQTVTVASNTPYIFSYWAANPYSQSPPKLRAFINGVQIGDLQLPSQTGQWVKFETVWNSGAATSATIRLVDLVTAGIGNDFTLDDISLQAVPEPATIWLLTTGISAVALRLRRKG
ncbi:MAG: PEP-CTERM sorting domain-containing protein [Armatimonadota bacterium]